MISYKYDLILNCIGTSDEEILKELCNIQLDIMLFKFQILHLKINCKTLTQTLEIVNLDFS